MRTIGASAALCVFLSLISQSFTPIKYGEALNLRAESFSYDVASLATKGISEEIVILRDLQGTDNTSDTDDTGDTEDADESKEITAIGGAESQSSAAAVGAGIGGAIAGIALGAGATWAALNGYFSASKVAVDATTAGPSKALPVIDFNQDNEEGGEYNDVLQEAEEIVVNETIADAGVVEAAEAADAEEKTSV